MRRVVVLMVVALLALGLMAAPASAAPADGKCVSNGVQTLGGKGLGLISTAATGGLETFTGERNSVPVVIADHLFNGADVTESLTPVLVGDSVTICD